MGWLWLFGFLAIVNLAARLAARHLFGQPAGLPLTLASGVLAWSWVTIGLQALGVSGLLNRGALFGLAAIGLAIAWGMRALRPAPPDLPGKPPGGWDAAATLALGLVIGSALIIGVPALLVPPKIVSDGPIYHLFFAAKWWKAGRVFLIASPFGENAATYFPANGDLWFSGLMALYGGDRPARVGQSPFLLMAGVSSYAIARRLGAEASASLIATAWAITSLPLLLFAFEANVDAIFVAGYLAAVFFGLRYALGDDGLPALVLSGLAAGLAWGTKPTASAFVPPLLLLGAWVVLAGPISRRAKLGHLAALAVASLAGCGFWFGRGLVLAGNPLYPLHVEAFGRTWLRGWYRSADMSASQFFLPVADWRSLVSIAMTVFDPRLVPAWLAALLGAWAWGRPRAALDRWIWAMSAMAVGNVAIYWLAIPYRTQQRFMLQALGLAAVPLARLLDRSGVVRWGAVALLAIHLTTGQSWPVGEPNKRAPWELSDKVPSVAAAPVQLPLDPEKWRDLSAQPGGPAYLATLVGAVVGSFALGWLWSRAARGGAPRLWAMAAGSSAALTIGYAGLVDAIGGGASGRVFPTFPDYQDAWIALEGISPKRGTNVAYAGTNLPYFLMAGGLRNDVSYVNVDGHPGWQMHDYHLSAADRGDPAVWGGPRPGWDRVHPDYAAWLRNLRSARIGLLVVARANPVDGPFNLADEERFPIERVWADAHPEAFARVYPRDRPDPQMRIYRVLPPKSRENPTDRAGGRHQ